jgi:hypothetical protein
MTLHRVAVSPREQLVELWEHSGYRLRNIRIRLGHEFGSIERWNLPEQNPPANRSAQTVPASIIGGC